ncbi:glycosyltransferase [Brevibacillus panacihumi]|uniref:glycosyltransferase n=1 Tax=Brevibacillus panacihumi TaxID=497735 RepID=UPI003D027016
MKQKLIIMLLFKDIVHDNRVIKEINSLAELGYQIVLFCLRNYDEIPSFPNDVTIYRFNITNNIKKSAVKIFFDIYKAIRFYYYIKKSLSNIYKKYDYIVCHAHDLNTLPFAYMLTKRFKLNKLVYDSHEIFIEMDGRRKVEKILGSLVERYCVKRVDHMITVSKPIQEYFKKIYPNKEITVIRNVPYLTEINNHDNQYFREKYCLPSDSAILIYVGGITRNRGLEQILQAVHVLPKNYVLIFMGYGNMVDQIKSLARQMQITDRLFFHEPVTQDKMLKIISSADVGLLLYQNSCLNNYLALPNKLFEYIQAELPVVASNFPAISELAIGQLCSPDDPVQIAESIRMAFTIDEKSNILNAKKQLNWDTEQQKLKAIYEGV